MRRYTLLPFIVTSFAVHAGLDPDAQVIQDRIKPVGEVNVEKTPGQPATPPETPPANKEASQGQTVFEHHCIVCHRDGIAGAPKFHDKTAWQARLAGRNIDDLVASAIKGKNAMPPKGTCQECSDSDIKAAINYMIPQP